MSYSLANEPEVGKNNDCLPTNKRTTKVPWKLLPAIAAMLAMVNTMDLAAILYFKPLFLRILFFFFDFLFSHRGTTSKPRYRMNPNSQKLQEKFGVQTPRPTTVKNRNKRSILLNSNSTIMQIFVRHFFFPFWCWITFPLFQTYFP